MDDKLTRIGIFYDGGHFSSVSDYYRYHHERSARISIEGLHRFVRWKVAEAEGANERHCQVVDAHYFRGRRSASEAERKGTLLGDRQFDDVLMGEGVTTHYMPLSSLGEKKVEKGIDVWFALEAFELAMYKRFTVSVLVTGDGDYVPLVRKLNTLGTRVMLLAWDFTYTDTDGKPQETRTSRKLLEEVTYSIPMDQIIEDRALRTNPLVNGLFVQRQERTNAASEETGREPLGTSYTATETEFTPSEPVREQGEVKFFERAKNWGFLIRPTGEDIFVHMKDVVEGDPSEVLKQGRKVEYEVGRNSEGKPKACSVRLVS